MTGSILTEIRVLCDVDEFDASFDGQLIPLINTYLFRSAQLGVGRKGFCVTGEGETWDEFIPENSDQFAAVKNYIGLRVKLVFDPPDNTGLFTALKEEARELEWCLYSEADLLDSK